MTDENSSRSTIDNAAAKGQFSVTVASLNTSVPRTNTRPPPIRRGVTKEEIGELITHLAFYAGWPAAMTAALVAKDVFEKTDERRIAGPQIAARVLSSNNYPRIKPSISSAAQAIA